MFLVGGAAALFAVLPLGSSWNHYGYAFAAVTAMTVAAAWNAAPRWGRGVIVAIAALNLIHGAVVMLAFQHVGRVQAVFSPMLAQAVQAAGPGTAESTPIRLKPAADAKVWIFQRLTHEIPSYRGVPIGARVRMVEAGAAADYRIEPDGRLTPLR
ncbi:MAG: hypothetical protein E6Q88_04140 [Lysobacteraceae bacterium]|nr:MAG: hypothetical protein E6Q88_04140 [Xanthomonadaceae bacterium]